MEGRTPRPPRGANATSRTWLESSLARRGLRPAQRVAEFSVLNSRTHYGATIASAGAPPTLSTLTCFILAVSITNTLCFCGAVA